jgi:hypothetical protein
MLRGSMISGATKFQWLAATGLSLLPARGEKVEACDSPLRNGRMRASECSELLFAFEMEQGTARLRRPPLTLRYQYANSRNT